MKTLESEIASRFERVLAENKELLPRGLTPADIARELARIACETCRLERLTPWQRIIRTLTPKLRAKIYRRRKKHLQGFFDLDARELSEIAADVFDLAEQNGHEPKRRRVRLSRERGSV